MGRTLLEHHLSMAQGGDEGSDAVLGVVLSLLDDPALPGDFHHPVFADTAEPRVGHYCP